VQAVDDQANESLNKLRTILSLYNPEQYSPRILSVNKDVWLQKIEDAYHAYLGSVRFLDEFYTQDEKEEAETEHKCVHDDVVNFVATLLNKSSLSVNQSTSTMAAMLLMLLLQMLRVLLKMQRKLALFQTTQMKVPHVRKLLRNQIRKLSRKLLLKIKSNPKLQSPMKWFVGRTDL